MEAKKIAKYLISQKMIEPVNSLNGNMKLQKLLYFAQLISLAKEDKPLFEDEVFAFENGMVIETVRKDYRDNFADFSNCQSIDLDLSANDAETLEMTIDLFGNLTANELSEITHTHKSWYERYHGSVSDNGYKDTDKSKVSVDELKLNEINGIQDLLRSYNQSKLQQNNENEIEIRGITYYYDPAEVTKNDILEFTAEFDPVEEAYSLFYQNGELLAF